MKWSEVVEHPEFKRRSAAEQEQTRDQYFREFVAPKFPEQDLPKIREAFDSDTYIRKQDLPQGVMPSTAGAGRGDEMPGRGVPTLADRMQATMQPTLADAAPVPPRRRGGLASEFKPYVGEAVPAGRFRGASGDTYAMPTQRADGGLSLADAGGYTPTPEDLTINSAAPRTRAAMAAPVLQDMAQRANDQERLDARTTGAPRKIADVGVAAGAGVVTGFKLLADAVGGAGNPASEVLQSAHEAVQSLRSAAARQDEKRIGAIMKAAEDSGVWDGLGAAAKAFGVAPASMIAQGLGTSVPGILAMLLPGVRESTIAALATAGAVGGVQGAGSVKGNIYEAVQAEMLGRGMSADEAKDRARAAQAYLGENADQIALGTAIGVLAGSTGGERFAINTIRSVLGKEALRESAKGGAKSLIKGTLTEGATEGAQGGQEQLASNMALQREGANVPTMRGVVSSGGVEALAGVGSGAVMGAADMATAKTPEQEVAGAINQSAAAFDRFFRPAPEATAPTAARADSLKRFDEAAAAWGLSPKAAAAVREQAGAMIPDEVPGFLARATAALSKRGLFRRPVDEAGLTDLDKRLRPTEPEKADVAQPDLAAAAPESVGAGDGGSDPAARGVGTVGPVPAEPQSVVPPAEAPAASGGPDQPVADGSGPDPALTVPQSARSPEDAIARMAEQDRQDYTETRSRAIAADNAPEFEDRAEDDIVSEKGKPWASKTLANKRLRDLPNGYRLARVNSGWVIKPESIADPAQQTPAGGSPVSTESTRNEEDATRPDEVRPGQESRADAQGNAQADAQEVQNPVLSQSTDGAAALTARGFKDTGPAPGEWVLPVSNLGDVIAKVVSKPGEPIRAEISADYMGKRLDTRTAEGDAAIDEAIQRARDGIQKGREKMAAQVVADERGLPTPETPYLSTWTDTNAPDAAAPDEKAPPTGRVPEAAAPATELADARRQLRAAMGKVDAVNAEWESLYREALPYFSGDGPSRKLSPNAPDAIKERYAAFKASKKDAQRAYDDASAQVAAATPKAIPAPAAPAPAVEAPAQATKPRQPNGSDTEKARALFKLPPAPYPTGSTVTLDGKPYTVAKTGAKSVTLADAEGKKRTVQQGSATWGKIQSAEAPEPSQSGGVSPSGAAVATKQPEASAPIDSAANAAATSPANDRPEPTQAQKEAGNYALGHHRLAGLDLSIENPAGSVRRGTDKKGKAWENTLRHHYGYIKGTVGHDKDHLDAFVKPGTPDDWAGTVFVIDQVHPETGKFDEHKAMLGFDTIEDAKAAYAANYDKGWRGMSAISAMPVAEFKAWALSDAPKVGALAAAPAASAKESAPEIPASETEQGKPERPTALIEAPAVSSPEPEITTPPTEVSSSPAARRVPKSFRKKHKVKATVFMEETGKFEQRDIDAETALAALDADIKALREFRACIGG